MARGEEPHHDGHRADRRQDERPTSSAAGRRAVAERRVPERHVGRARRRWHASKPSNSISRSSAAPRRRLLMTRLPTTAGCGRPFPRIPVGLAGIRGGQSRSATTCSMCSRAGADAVTAEADQHARPLHPVGQVVDVDRLAFQLAQDLLELGHRVGVADVVHVGVGGHRSSSCSLAASTRLRMSPPAVRVTSSSPAATSPGLRDEPAVGPVGDRPTVGEGVGRIEPGDAGSNGGHVAVGQVEVAPRFAAQPASGALGPCRLRVERAHGRRRHSRREPVEPVVGALGGAGGLRSDALRDRRQRAVGVDEVSRRVRRRWRAS